DDTVAALTVHQGDLVIGGHFDTAGGVTVNGIARWTGRTWQPFLVGGEIGLSGSVRSFVTWNGDLVVGGDFMEAGGLTVCSITRWTGAAWQPFSTGLHVPLPADTPLALCMAMHD